MPTRLARAAARTGRLPRSFYARPALTVARAVLGRRLVHDSADGSASGLIVEVEAYRGADDPASHAYHGRTPRNATMFGPAGHLYVYFTYGMHHCLNLVTGRPGVASAVLVRALEPLEGEDLMRRRRGLDEWRRLARGPGCVTQALGLTRAHDGLDLTRGPVWIDRSPPDRRGLPTNRGLRIGVRLGRDHDWRFFLAGHPCVSPPSGSRGRRVRMAPRLDTPKAGS